MSKLHKKDIKKLVKKANEDLMSENYPYLGSERSAARKQDTLKFDKYSQQTYMLLKQLQRDITSDFETGNLSKLQIEYLVNTVLPTIIDQVNYTVSTINAMQQQGIKHTDPRDFNPYE